MDIFIILFLLLLLLKIFKFREVEDHELENLVKGADIITIDAGGRGIMGGVALIFIGFFTYAIDLWHAGISIAIIIFGVILIFLGVYYLGGTEYPGMTKNAAMPPITIGTSDGRLPHAISAMPRMRSPPSTP